MIKVIVFNGGLGNQMFQYAFYLALEKEHPWSLYLWDIEKSNDCHYGFELRKIFNIQYNYNVKQFELFYKLFRRILNHFKYLKQENALKYYSNYIADFHLFAIYEGFWQSEKYFEKIKDEIKDSFVFKQELLSEKTKEMAQKLKAGSYCSIHVRRGDYLLQVNKNGMGIISQKYYNEAIEYIKSHVEGVLHFCVFSDDMGWCRQNLPIESAVYVDWNTGVDSWQDMYLMSKCKHNIIANSSFSWWGAWLNENSHKIVVAPKPWFIQGHHDIIPDKWITIAYK